MATWETLMTQDGSSPMMDQLAYFHDHTLLVLSMITVLVGYLLGSLFSNTYNHRYLLEGQTIEVSRTVFDWYNYF